MASATATTTAIPKTMRGILIEKTGGVEVLQYRTDLPVPVPGEGQVLVKNEVVGINYIDTYYRTGLYPSPKPEILGREGSGTIVSVGPPSVTSPHDLTPSTRVVYLGAGAYAEYTAVGALHVVKLPTSISAEAACATLIQGLTALTLVIETAPVQRGDWALVHAAAGGVGGMLCRVLKRRGVGVVATAGDARKRKIALASGAAVAVGYGTEEVLGAVREKAGDDLRAVYDGVGKATFDLSLEAVGRKGTVASFGNASGPVEPFTISRLASKSIKVARPTLFPYIATRAEFEGYTAKLFELLADPTFDVPVHKVYDLADVASAHTDLESRGTVGKLLLKI